MTRFRVLALIVGILVLCMARQSSATPEECQEASSEYNSAMEDIGTALVACKSCRSSSGGHDDCSTEFAAVKSAQDDFEDAVSKYESECN
jgi:hypothetical protein